MKQIDEKINELIETDLLLSYINGYGKSHFPLVLVFGYSQRAYNHY